MEAAVSPAGAPQAPVPERCAVVAELQDLVTHDLTQLTVQLAAVRRLLATDPDRAPRVLADAEATARAAVGNMRRTAGLLPTAERDGHRPLPGLGDLEDLVAVAAADDVALRVSCDGVPTTVPASTGLAVYRVVEESIRSAHGCVDVALLGGTDALQVRVTRGAGRCAHCSAADTERLRARAALYGGRLRYRPDEEGDVVVEFPLERTDRA